MPRRRTDALVALWLLVSPSPAVAQGNDEAQANDELRARREADEAFRLGTGLVGDAKWAEALAAFERAEQRVPHAITTFNIGACERALGRHAAARDTFRRAIAEHRSGRTVLPERLVTDAEAFALQSERILARVHISVAPRGARLEVDGRPLTARAEMAGGAPEVWLTAGIRKPGPGDPLPADDFVLEADPGRHVLRFTRDGARDGIVERDFVSGDNPPIHLELDDLPATIRVAADQRGALVKLDGRDLGPAPISVLRPGGSYRVIVEKEGFQPSESLLRVAPGQAATYRAKLLPEQPSILETWWFWTIAGVAVTGAVVGTYLAVSDPEPTRPQAGGGSLGFRVPIP